MNPQMFKERAIKFFKKIVSSGAIPLKEGNGWFKTGVFSISARGAVVTSPSSRNQELHTLAIEITNWALKSNTSPFIMNKWEAKQWL